MFFPWLEQLWLININLCYNEITTWINCEYDIEIWLQGQEKIYEYLLCKFSNITANDCLLELVLQKLRFILWRNVEIDDSNNQQHTNFHVDQMIRPQDRWIDLLLCSHHFHVRKIFNWTSITGKKNQLNWTTSDGDIGASLLGRYIWLTLHILDRFAHIVLN